MADKKLNIIPSGYYATDFDGHISAMTKWFSENRSGLVTLIKPSASHGEARTAEDGSQATSVGLEPSGRL